MPPPRTQQNAGLQVIRGSDQNLLQRPRKRIVIRIRFSFGLDAIYMDGRLRLAIGTAMMTMNISATTIPNGISL